MRRLAARSDAERSLRGASWPKAEPAWSRHSRAQGGVRLVPPNIRRLPRVASPPGAPLQVGVRLLLVLAVLRAAEQPVRVAQLEARLLERLAEASGAIAEHRTWRRRWRVVEVEEVVKVVEVE